LCKLPARERFAENPARRPDACRSLEYLPNYAYCES
jgi:hypothetical protein